MIDGSQNTLFYDYTIAKNDKNNIKLRGNCYLWLVVHLLCLQSPSLRVDDRLLETEKALELNFAEFFLKTGEHFYYWVSTIDVAIVVTMEKDTLRTERPAPQSEKKRMNIKELFLIEVLKRADAEP